MEAASKHVVCEWSGEDVDACHSFIRDFLVVAYPVHVPASRSVGARDARVAKEKKREARRRWEMVRRAALRMHGHQLRRCLRSWLLVVRARCKF